MKHIEITLQKNWLCLALDALNAVERLKTQQETDPELATLLELQEEAMTDRYNNYMDQLLTNHVNIESINQILKK